MHSTRSLILVTAPAVLARCQMAPMVPDPTGRADADMLRVLTALPVEQARAQSMPGGAATIIAVSTDLPAKMLVADA